MTPSSTSEVVWLRRWFFIFTGGICPCSGKSFQQLLSLSRMSCVEAQDTTTKECEGEWNYGRLITVSCPHHTQPIRRRENCYEGLFNRSVEGYALFGRAYGLLSDVVWLYQRGVQCPSKPTPHWYVRQSTILSRRMTMMTETFICCCSRRA